MVMILPADVRLHLGPWWQREISTALGHGQANGTWSAIKRGDAIAQVPVCQGGSVCRVPTMPLLEIAPWQPARRAGCVGQRAAGAAA